MRQHRAEVWSTWRGLVSEQLQSGQGVAAFCRERSLREWQFYEWKKRLRESETVKFVEVKAVATREPKGTTAARSLAIELRLRQGRSLMVEPGFDADHLRALLAALETEA